jgi:hypothetical protein
MEIDFAAGCWRKVRAQCQVVRDGGQACRAAFQGSGCRHPMSGRSRLLPLSVPVVARVSARFCSELTAKLLGQRFDRRS